MSNLLQNGTYLEEADRVRSSQLLLHGGPVGRGVEDGRHVVDVVDVDNHRGRLLVETVRCDQVQLVL